MAGTPGGVALAGGAVRRSRSGWGFARREAMWGYLFISPWIAGFLFFTLLPMLAALALSFTNFDLRRPDEIEFIGLRNYERLFVDRGVQGSLLTTIRYILITVPLNLVFSLAVA